MIEKTVPVSAQTKSADPQNGPDLDAALEHVSQLLQQSVPFDSGGILFCDAETQLLYPRVYQSRVENMRLPRLFQLNEGHFQQIARTHEAMIVSNIAQSNYVRCDPEAQSAIVIPVIQDRQFLGVLFAESHQTHAYTKSHEIVLTALADYVALAAQSSKQYDNLHYLYEQVSSYNDQMILQNEISKLVTDDLLSESLWPRLVEYLTRFSHADGCAITLWDEDNERVQILGAYGDDALKQALKTSQITPFSFDWDALTRKLAYNHRPLILNPAWAIELNKTGSLGEDVRALLAMPLIARQRYVGAVLLVNSNTNRPFTNVDVNQLTSVLDKVALTIDNNALFRRLQTQLSEASALLEVGRIATGTPEIDPMLRQVIEFTCRSLQVPIGAVFLHDPNTETLQVRVGRSVSPQQQAELEQIHLSINDPNSFTARAFRTGNGFFMNNVVADIHEPHYDSLKRIGLKNRLEVPIRIQDKSIGIMMVSGKVNDFTQSDLDFLTAICNYLSAALRSADLLSQTRQQLQETETLRRIASITSSGINMDTMLEQVSEQVAKLVSAQGATVFIFDQGGGWLVPNDHSRYGIARRANLPVIYIQDQSPIAAAYRRPEIHIEPFFEVANLPEKYSLVTCPLRVHHRTLGVLALFEIDLESLQDAQIESLWAAAAQIAVSIESAQLFAAERQRADLMSLINQIGQTLASTLDFSGLTRKVVKNAHDLLGYDAVFLYTLSDDQKQIMLTASATNRPDMRLPDNSQFPLLTGLVGRAIATGETQSLINSFGSADVFWPAAKHRVFSELIFPLRTHDQIFGALEIVSGHPNGLREAERTALETLAAQTAAAMENSRLWEQAQRRLLEDGIVSQIGNVLVSILDYKQLGEAIVQHMARALDTSACILVSYNAATSNPVIEAEYRQPELILRWSSRIGQAPTEIELALILRAIHTRRLAIYPNTIDLPLPSSDGYNSGAFPITTAIALPLIARDRTIGCMVWLDARPERKFIDGDVRLAQTLAPQAAIAVENAQLFAELQDRAFELAKANALKSEFLARVSHELRTPLNSIIGYSDMLINRLYGHLNEKQADRIQRVLRNGLNLLRLIDDLLDISRIDAGKLDLHLEPLNVADDLKAVLDNLESQATEHGLYMRSELPAGLPRLLGDSFRLRQVLTNLIGNAIKFTKVGGITVRAEPVMRESRLLILIQVIDTGIGIRSEDQQIIFDEFRQADGTPTREYGGTGLGLAITRRFVDLMGGKIWVESQVGQGSTFSFTLPAAVDQALLE